MLDPKKLSLKEFWQARNRPFPKLEALSRTLSFKKGNGLPGRVWAEHGAVWVEDFSQETHFPRFAVAKEEGVGTAIGFPVAFGPSFLGVVELFASGKAVRDTGLLECSPISEHKLDPSFSACKAERALAESEARKAAILNAVLDCIVTIDEQGNVIEWNRAAEQTFGYRHADAIGEPIAKLIIPEAFRTAHANGMAHFLSTGEGPVLGKLLELTAIRRGGAEVPCRACN